MHMLPVYIPNAAAKCTCMGAGANSHVSLAYATECRVFWLGVQLLDRIMVLVPDTEAHLRHLVPFPRLANRTVTSFPDRGYALKPLPEASMAAAMAAIRGGPTWLRDTYAHSPSSLNASDLSRAGTGDGTLPEKCAKPSKHNYTFLCA